MRRARTISIVAVVISTLALFFFHLSFGSFQSTHGPTASVNAQSNSIDLPLAMSVPMLMALVPSLAPSLPAVERLAVGGFTASVGLNHIALRC